MTAIIGGNCLGLALSSLSSLGGGGIFGRASTGQAGEGVYVNGFSGNLVLQHRDELLLGQGLDVEALRTYNSLGTANDDNGDNWSTGIYDKQIRLSSGNAGEKDSIVQRIGRDGGTARFQHDGTRYVELNVAGPCETITYDSVAKTYTWTDGQGGTKEVYSSTTGKLLSRTDASGNKLTYTYDTNTPSLLRSIQDANGECLLYDYTGTQLTAVRIATALDGVTTIRSTTHYEYDTSGRLSKVKLDLTPDDNSITDGKVYTVEYTYEDTSKRVSTMKQSDGTLLTFGYKDYGGVLRVSSVRDAVGNTTSIDYDTAAFKTKVKINNQETVYSYDSKGRLMSVSEPAVDGSSSVTSYTYDGNNNVTSITDAANRVTSFVYDSTGLLLTRSDATGSVITYTYNALNQVISETHSTVPIAALADQKNTKCTGDTITKIAPGVEGNWDASANSVDAFTGGASLAFYPGQTNKACMVGLTAGTDAGSNWNSIGWAFYLRSDNKLQIREGTTVDQLQTPPTYQATDRLMIVYDATAKTVTYLMNDKVLRTVSNVTITTPVHLDTSFSSLGAKVTGVRFGGMSAPLATTRFVYDAAGKGLLRYTISPEGRVVEYTYDAKGQLARTNVYPVGLYPLAGRTSSSVPTEAEMNTWRPADLSATQLTKYARDARGQIKTVTTYAATSTDGTTGTGASATNYTYDVSGRLVLVVDAANSAQTSYAYDGLARLTLSTEPLVGSTTTAYDDTLRTITVTAAGESSVTTYDTAGRVVSVAHSGTNVTSGTTSTAYDAADRPLQVTLPDGTRSWALYDAAGRKVADITGDGTLTEYAYDPSGLVTRVITYATRCNTSLLVDAQGKPLNPALSALRPAATTADRKQWTIYDDGGRVVQVVRQVGDTASTVTQMAYDADGHVLSARRFESTVNTSSWGTSHGPASPTPSAADLVTHTVRGADGLPVYDVDAAGYVTYHEYDAAGHEIRTTRYANPVATSALADAATVSQVAQLVSANAATDRVTMMRYGDDGRLHFTLTPSPTAADAGLGAVVKYSYDLNGNLTLVQAYNNRFNVSDWRSDADPVINASNLDHVTRRIYDEHNRLVLQIDPAGSTTEYTYDAQNQVVKTVRHAEGFPTGAALRITPGTAGATNSATRPIGALAAGETITATVAFLGPVTTPATTAKLRLRNSAGTIVATGTALSANNGWQQLTLSWKVTTAGSYTIEVCGDPGTDAAHWVRFDNLLVSGSTSGEMLRDVFDSITPWTLSGSIILVGSNAEAGGPDDLARDYVTKALVNSTTDSVERTVRDAAGNPMLTVDATGAVARYTTDGLGRVTQVVRFAARAANGGGTKTDAQLIADWWALAVDTTKDQLTRTLYDTAGRVSTVVDGGGTATAMSYDTSGHVTLQRTIAKTVALTGTDAQLKAAVTAAIDDTKDRVTRNVYDTAGRLNIAIDAAGQATEYDYDAFDRITTTRKLAMPVPDGGAMLLTTTRAGDYGYTRMTLGSGFKVGEKVVATVRFRTDPGSSGSMYVREQSADGQTTLAIDDTGVVAGTNGWVTLKVQINVTSETGVVSVVLYANRNKASSGSMSAAYDEFLVSSGTRGTIAEKTFDTLAPSEWYLGYATMTSKVTSLAMAGTDEQLTAVVKGLADDDRDHVTRVLYDGDGRPTIVLDPEGTARQVSYDQDGNVTQERVYAKPMAAGWLDLSDASVVNKVAALTDAEKDQASRFIYDLGGRLKLRVAPDGAATTYEYDTFGNALKQRRLATEVPTGGAMQLTATTAGTYGYTRMTLGSGFAVGDTLVATVRFRTDPGSSGSMYIREQSADGKTTNAIGDTGVVKGTDGWVTLTATIKITATTGVVSVVLYANRNAASSGSMSAAYDGLTVVSSIKGRIRDLSFDAGGDPAWSYGNATQTTSFSTPAEAGTDAQLSALVDAMTDDARDQIYWSSYDRQGRLASTTQPGAVTTRYVYDALNLRTTTDGNSTVTSYGYDLEGRCIQETRDAGGLKLTRKFVYDVFGNRVATVEANNGVSRYTYDARNGLVYAVDAVGAVTYTERDSFGQSTRTTRYANAIDLTGLAQVVDSATIATKLTGKPDATKDLVEVARYDVAGRLRFLVTGDGGVTEYRYDGLDQVIDRIAYVKTIAMGSWNIATDPVVVASANDQAEHSAYDRSGQRTTRQVSASIVQTWTYDAFGNVSTFADGTTVAAKKPGAAPAARVTTMVYDAANRLVATVDPGNGVVRNDYDAFGQCVHSIAYVTPAYGIKSQPTLNDVMAKVTASVPGTDSSQDAETWRVYDLAGRQIWEVTAQGDGKAAAVRSYYDADDRLTSRVAYGQRLPLSGWVDRTAGPTVTTNGTVDRSERFAYDGVGRLTFTSTGAGQVTGFVYDKLGNVLSTTQYAKQLFEASAPDDDAKDRITLSAYDVAGNLTRRASSVFNATTHDTFDYAVSVFDRDALGRLLKQTDFGTTVKVPSSTTLAAVTITAAGTVDHYTTYTYDLGGRVSYSADSIGRVTETDYDGAGRTIASTLYVTKVTPGTFVTAATADADGVQNVNAKDRKTSYVYDAAGRVTQSTDAMGYVESWEYDAAGRRTLYTNKKHDSTQFVYDDAGNLASETLLTAVLVATTSADTSGVISYSEVSQTLTTSYKYDAQGHLLMRTEADSLDERKTSYSYDACGRQIATVYPRVSSATQTALAAASSPGSGRVEGDPASQTSRTYYDVFGNAVAGIDAAGTYSYKVYDKANRVTTTIDALGGTTRFVYDAFGDQLSMTRYALDSVPADGSTWTLKSPTSAADAPEVNDIAFVTDPADRAIVRTYDHAGHLLTETGTAVFVWNSAAGGATSPSKTENTYDAFGNLVQIDRTIDTATVATECRYYDKAGRQVYSVNPTGFATYDSWDVADNHSSHREYSLPLTTWKVYDPAAPADYTNPVTTDNAISVDGDHYTVWHYDADNRTIDQTNYYARVSTDNGNGLSDISAAALANLTTKYTYDAAGNRTSATDPLNGVTYTYYDPMGRVMAEIRPAVLNEAGAKTYSITEYRRDAFGNVVRQIDRFNSASTPVLAGVYDSSVSGKLGYTVTTSASDVFAYTVYDKLGNVTQTQRAGNIRIFYSYAAGGRLLKTWQPVTAYDKTVQYRVTSYEYDALGQVLNVYTPSVVTGNSPKRTRMVYNAFGEVTTQASYLNGATTTTGVERYRYDDAGRVWSALGIDGVTHIYFYDRLGRKTADIVSDGGGYNDDGTDLSTYTDPADLPSINLMSGLRRTDTTYDAAGGVVQITQPRQSAAVGGFTSIAQTMQVTDVTSGQMTFYSEDGWYTNVADNELTLSFTSLTNLGPGAIDITIVYKDSQGTSHSKTVLYDGLPPPVVDGQHVVSLKWADQPPVWGNNGEVFKCLNSITEVKIRKKDVAGNFQTVADETSGSLNNGTVIKRGTAIAYSCDRDATVPTYLKYWVGNGTPTRVAMTNYGFTSMWRANTPLSGTYSFQIETKDDAGNYVSVGDNGAGTFTVNATTDGTANGWSQPRPVITQQVDRWGHVKSRTDPRNAAWTTTFTYDTFGHQLSQANPNGTGHDTPTYTYYDALGRVVGTKDPLSHVNGQWYDATGHVVKELHADGGVVTSVYDLLGRRSKQIDAVGNAAPHDTEGDKVRLAHTTIFSYDLAGNLLQAQSQGYVGMYYYEYVNVDSALKREVIQPTRIYAYDEAGQRISSGSIQNADHEIYYFDVAGNLVKTTSDFPEYFPETFASWDDWGHQTSATDKNGNPMTWKYDYYGRLLEHVDLAKDKHLYTYDNAGQLAQHTSKTATGGAQVDLRYNYSIAGQLTSQADYREGATTARDNYTWYYDLAGHKLREQGWHSGSVTQDNHLSYDEQGRLVLVQDERMQITYEYDAAGNRKHVRTHVMITELNDRSRQDLRDENRWYFYDAMNRMTTADALNASGDIGYTSILVEGVAKTVGQGHILTYDLNGNRTSDKFWGVGVIKSNNETWTLKWNAADADTGERRSVSYLNWVDSEFGEYFKSRTGLIEEKYAYDNADRLITSVRSNINGTTLREGTAYTTYDSTLVDARYYDRQGNLSLSGLPLNYLDDYAGFVDAVNDAPDMDTTFATTSRRQIHYQGTLWKELITDWSGKKIRYTDNYHDKAGNLQNFSVDIYDDDGDVAVHETHQLESELTDTYLKTKETVYVTGKANRVSVIDYDANGYMTGYDDQVLSANDRTYYNDANGQALQINQNTTTNRQVIVNGEVVARHGLGVDPTKEHRDFEAPGFGQIEQYNLGYRKIASDFPSASVGQYTVQPGDTLRGIALAAFGDSAMWYQIADANGFNSDADLRIGQSIRIPNSTGSTHYNTSTFRPYDASAVIGNTSPASAAPPHADKGCGPMGVLVMVVVAVVVSVITAGAAAVAMAAMAEGVAVGSAVAAAGVSGCVAAAGAAAGTAIGVAAGAIGAAVGSIASQAVGIAIGAQDGFSWKQVGSAAIGGAIGGGFAQGGGTAATGFDWSSMGTAMARGAFSSTMGQGIAVACHLQDHFSWRQVAASTVSAGVGNAVGQGIDAGFGALPEAWQPSADVASFTRNLGTGLASSATASAVRSGHVDWENVAADAFGNAIGQAIVDSTTRRERTLDTLRRQLQKLANDTTGGDINQLPNSEPLVQDYARAVSQYVNDASEEYAAGLVNGTRSGGDARAWRSGSAVANPDVSELQAGQNYRFVVTPGEMPDDSNAGYLTVRVLGAAAGALENVGKQVISLVQLAETARVATGYVMLGGSVNPLNPYTGGQQALSDLGNVFSGLAQFARNPGDVVDAAINERVQRIQTERRHLWGAETVQEHVNANLFYGREIGGALADIVSVALGVVALPEMALAAGRLGLKLGAKALSVGRKAASAGGEVLSAQALALRRAAQAKAKVAELKIKDLKDKGKVAWQSYRIRGNEAKSALTSLGEATPEVNALNLEGLSAQPGKKIGFSGAYYEDANGVGNFNAIPSGDTIRPDWLPVVDRNGGHKISVPALEDVTGAPKNTVWGFGIEVQEGGELQVSFRSGFNARNVNNPSASRWMPMEQQDRLMALIEEKTGMKVFPDESRIPPTP